MGEREREWYRLTSVVIMMQEALGLIVRSPVIRPTSLNSSHICLYFWLLRAWEGRRGKEGQRDRGCGTTLLTRHTP